MTTSHISTEISSFMYKCKASNSCSTWSFRPYHYFATYFDRTEFIKCLWGPKPIPYAYIYPSCVFQKHLSICYKLSIVQPGSLLINLKLIYFIYDSNRKTSKETDNKNGVKPDILFCVSVLGVQLALKYKVDSSYQKSISKKLEKFVVWKNLGAMP